MRRAMRNYFDVCLPSCLLVWAFLIVSSAALGDDWPSARGNPMGTGATESKLPDAPALLWQVDIEGLGFDAGPIIADGTVYAADADGRVVALQLSDGQERWRFKVDSGFLAAPAYSQGTLFVGDYDGVLRAIDAASGKEKWKFDSEMEIDAGPNFFKESVLFTSRVGTLYALNRADGELLWKYETDDQLQCVASLAGDRTFLGGCDAHLHVVNVETGKAVRKPLPLDAPTGSTPSVSGDLVIVPTYAGEVFAFESPSNRLRWRFKDSKLAREFKNSAAVAQGLVILSSRNKRVFALDARTGKVVWQTTLRKRADASPIVAGDRVVVAAADGRILLLDLKTGKETWTFEAKGAFLASAAVADGRLVVASDRGTIYCLGEDAK